MLSAMERCADPLADNAVAAMMPTGGSLDTSGLAAATRLMASWTTNGSLTDWRSPDPDADPKVVQALQNYLKQGSALPDWVEPGKVARAEQLFMAHGPLSCTLLFCSSLPECYVLPHLADVLQTAGQLTAHTEHRIRQTAAMVFPVMMRGGLLSPAGSGVAQVLKVRLIHATIRRLILRCDPASASGRIAPRAQQGSNASLHGALAARGWDVDAQGLPCNQVELAYTLLTFSYCFLRGMRKLRQGLSREDEEAYLHAWNVMGHILGIERQLMAQTMNEAETLFQRIQQRAQTQQVLPDPRPPLGQALIGTMARSIKLPVIRHIPVPLTRWLIGADSARSIGVAQQIPWPTQALFWLGLHLTRIVDNTVQIFEPKFSLSRLITRIVGYHFLTRFLMDQTRPLNLPDHLLSPMHQALAEWSDDVHASEWVNRMEDRLTTDGQWRALPANQRHSQ